MGRQSFYFILTQARHDLSTVLADLLSLRTLYEVHSATRQIGLSNPFMYTFYSRYVQLLPLWGFSGCSLNASLTPSSSGNSSPHQPQRFGPGVPPGGFAHP